MRRLILTNAHFAAIPGMVAKGMTRNEIASKFGVTPGTLAVRCSTKRISLKVPAEFRKKKLHTEAVLRVRRDTIKVFEKEAKARCATPNQIASKLLELIAKDGLFNAILDDAA